MPIVLAQPTPHVALVTIDNPAKRNALSRAMLAELAALWDTLEASTVRCIVITGAGDKAFSAGADISGDLSASEDTARIINRALLKTSTYPKPIVAAVNGVCAGGGVELLLSTDIRYSVPEARFGLPEVKWGIYPFGGATAKLVAQVGYVNAMSLLLEGHLIKADEAQRIGLINHIVPNSCLLRDAIAAATRIAANSPQAVQAVKAQISETMALATLARESAEQARGERVRASADFAEGVSAFRDKRIPHYE